MDGVVHSGRVNEVLGIHPWRIAARALLVGLVSGVLAILFRALMEACLDLARRIAPLLREDWRVTVAWVVAASLTVAALTVLLRWEPDAGGSGIPQVKGVIQGRLGLRPLRVLVVRSLAGALVGVFGLSLGREGPSIHIGASGGKLVASSMRADEVTTDYLVTAGGAAGLAAAFSAPLSGLFFALEGLHRSFSRPVMLAAAAGAFLAGGLASAVFGLTPILAFSTLQPLPIGDYPWMVAIGVVSGLTGVAMTRGLLGFQDLYARVPVPARLGVALGIAIVIQMTVPDLLGGGENLIALAQRAGTGLGVLALLWVGKALFTMTSFSSGVPGGIFMPILAVGALSGAVGAGLLVRADLLPAGAVPVAAVAAMAGALAGSVKSPLTAIMLTVEMVGSVQHILPVALCAFTALGVADLVGSPDIYGALLRRRIAAAHHGVTATREARPGHGA